VDDRAGFPQDLASGTGIHGMADAGVVTGIA